MSFKKIMKNTITNKATLTPCFTCVAKALSITAPQASLKRVPNKFTKTQLDKQIIFASSKKNALEE